MGKKEWLQYFISSVNFYNALYTKRTIRGECCFQGMFSILHMYHLISATTEIFSTHVLFNVSFHIRCSVFTCYLMSTPINIQYTYYLMSSSNGCSVYMPYLMSAPIMFSFQWVFRYLFYLMSVSSAYLIESTWTKYKFPVHTQYTVHALFNYSV